MSYSPMEDFKTFLNTMLHTESNDVVDLPDVSCSIVQVQYDDGDQRPSRFFLFREPPGFEHVEGKMVREVKEHLQSLAPARSENSRLRITCYQNYSPCTNSLRDDNKECAQALIQFHSDASGICSTYTLTMEIVFVGLYNIIRPYCFYDSVNGTNRRPCRHGPLYTLGQRPDVSTANVQGLQSLAQAGIRLRTFEDPDYNAVIDYLVNQQGADRPDLQAAWDNVRGRRQREDDFMKRDCQDLGIMLQHQ
ncbi:hypothetical protein BaRGS_00008914 [Batillaria attramentaria]|uniref:Activation-induced cytidine deaminase AID domain-containing protein n=1 Tax=Batillaria attramentaria TaxID=370345 RepID=A0ABD0LK90_9CAEN